MNPPRQQKGRKLLIASVGLATVSYLGCDGLVGETGGNLLPPPTGNLLPPPMSDAGPDADALPPPPTGNLVPPPPNDAGKDLDGSDADAPDGSGDAPRDVPPEMMLPPVGNLLPPPPLDAAPDNKDGGTSSKQDDKKA